LPLLGVLVRGSTFTVLPPTTGKLTGVFAEAASAADFDVQVSEQIQ
jgi:hypothetical protein